MPLKINMGGVIPVIFASSVLSMPQSLFAAFPPDPAKSEYGVGKNLDVLPKLSRQRSLLRVDLSDVDRVLHLLLRLDRFQR